VEIDGYRSINSNVKSNKVINKTVRKLFTLTGEKVWHFKYHQAYRSQK